MNVAGLPFPFEVRGDLRAGGAAQLRVDFSAPWEEAQFDQLRCVVRWFAELARLGAWCGAELAPARVTATLANGDEPTQVGPSTQWRFDTLAVDPHAAVTLANLLYATGLPIARVALVASGPDRAKDLDAEAFCERLTALPFVVEEDRQDENVELTIDLRGDCPPDWEEPLAEALRTWSLLAALGAYRSEGPLREALDLTPENDPQLVLDQLTFTFEDSALDEHAYDGLINLCAGFVSRGLAIDTVTLG